MSQRQLKVAGLFLCPMKLVSRLKTPRDSLEEWKKQAKKWTEHDLVFPSNFGTPHYPDSIRKLFKKLRKRLKLIQVFIAFMSFGILAPVCS